MHFFIFTYVLPVIFLCILLKLCQEIWNQHEILCDFFLIKKKFLRPYYHFLKLWSQVCKKRLKKPKLYFVNVSVISISHPSKGLGSSFYKKKLNLWYPSGDGAYRYFIESNNMLWWSFSILFQRPDQRIHW